ncbi:MAG: hypothetical protein FWC03_05800 [Treponema sp.]|nr:hypothetical protein [Treponema sp.]
MKRMVIMVTLAMLIASAVLAQGKMADAESHWISGELSLIGIGVSYEYLLLPQLSIGISAFLNVLVTQTYVVNLIGHYHPGGSRFFLELGLGLGSINGPGEIIVSEKNRDDWPAYLITTTGLSITPGLGWKIDFGYPGGFFIQPGVKLPIVIGKQKPWESINNLSAGNYSVPNQTGTAVTFIVFFSMGVSF